MREQYIKILDADAQTVHKNLQKAIVEDTKENVCTHWTEGIFMGKVGAKKFYVLYKPAYLRNINFMTVLRGDVSPTEDGKTKIRYRFGKFMAVVVMATILLALLTFIALYAFFTNETNMILNFCILGFWMLSAGLDIFSMISTRAAKERLIQFLEELGKG